MAEEPLAEDLMAVNPHKVTDTEVGKNAPCGDGNLRNAYFVG